MELNYWNLVAELLKVAPELMPAYREELAIWLPDEPGPHVVFGDVLTPHLIDLLERNVDVNALVKIFSFLEQLAASPNTIVQEVVGASVLERIGGKRLWRDRTLLYAGPATREILGTIRTAD